MVFAPHLAALGAWACCAAATLLMPSEPQDAKPPLDPAIIRYRVTMPDAEPLLGFLAQRLHAQGELVVGARSYASSILEERSEEAWFDDADLTLLGHGQRLRHVRRLANGRDSLQDALIAEGEGQSIRIDQGLDSGATTRIQDSLTLDDVFTPDARQAAIAQLSAFRVRDGSHYASLRIQRSRHGFLLTDASGQKLTFVVQRIASRQTDLALQWHELEAEVLPCDTSDQDARAAAEDLRAMILAEVLAACPRMQRADADDYPRIFERAQKATWLPLRLLHSLRVTDLEAKIAVLSASSILFATASALLAIRRLRKWRMRSRA
jgi:hypothetical protein